MCRAEQLQPSKQIIRISLVFPNLFGVKGLKTNYLYILYICMYVVYLSCDFVTKMMMKKINLKIRKSSLISGLWFGIVQFLHRNIQACLPP